MNILSWNVAGLRARIKNDENSNNHLIQCLFAQNNDSNIGYKYFDIVCLQETKCKEEQIKLPEEITIRYPYRYWNATKGTTQRQGFSGTTIWCSIEPKSIIPNAEFDEEGRIISLELEEFILTNVYVPNSQKIDSERYRFREDWNSKFLNYINQLKTIYNKGIIICGDMNVAHLDIDINNPKFKKNKIAGFFDNERIDFAYLLETSDLIDVYRNKYPKKQNSTYWSNFMKQPRNKENGWRIDYFLASIDYLKKNKIIDCKILNNIMGSDHCPVLLEIN